MMFSNARTQGILRYAAVAWLAMNLLWLSAGSLWAKEEEKKETRDAIVKIYTVSRIPDYFNPWRMLNTKNISGSGCIIKGKRILTNAHVVADHTFIQVRRYGQAKRYRARVLSVSHEADLALLTVDDDSFFSDVRPLKLGGLPQTQQEVLVYGFPVGGDSLSITKGILSRIEHQNYTHSSHYYLAGQIDAAINPGNSGGPVLVNDRIVGVVMQMYSPSLSENIGYMVPIPIIKHFFKDLEDGTYDGFPVLGLVTQKMENPDMKRKYGLTETMSGVVVNHVVLGSSAQGILEKGDVIVSIDGHSVGDDGTVELRRKERTHYSYYIDMHQLGEDIQIGILRRGSISRVTLPLNRTQSDFSLVPMEQYDQKPRFFIFGGIVFSPLTKNLLTRWGGRWKDKAPKEMVVELSKWPTQERREVVVAIQVLAADINRGYHDISSWIPTEVNGKKINDFDDLYETVLRSKDPFIVLRNDKKYHLVIDREKAIKSHDKILETYRIKEDHFLSSSTGSEHPRRR